MHCCLCTETILSRDYYAMKLLSTKAKKSVFSNNTFLKFDFFCNFFSLHVCKVLFIKPDICNLRRLSISCKSNFGTCSYLYGHFIVILSLPVTNHILQNISGSRDSSPSRFLFTIVIPRSKYIKNNV